jgi:integrase
MILFGFASALRPGELAALRVRDAIARPGGLLVVIRRSKTDQDGHGQVVGVATGRHPETDPVAALAGWMRTRPVGPGGLFTQINPAGAATRQSITGVTVSRIVRRRALAAGLREEAVSGQSLRAGHATTAAQNGAGVGRIAAQTRHRAVATLIEHYIRPADALARSTSRDLGLRPPS